MPIAAGVASAASTSVDLYVSSATSCTQGSPCSSIQNAIDYAEVNDGGSTTIYVAAGSYGGDNTITFTSFSQSLTISGAGASDTTVTGTIGAPVFTINFGTVTISGLTIIGADATEGSAVYSAGVATTLTNDAFPGDTATNLGGAFYNWAGTATMTNDTFSGDTAGSGGAVYNGGTATMTNDTFSSDTATTSGGGVGGAVANGGTATMTNDTFSGDTATASGGAVYNGGSGPATMTDDTFSSDTAGYLDGGGGAVDNAVNTATISNSILDSAGCSGTITDGGHNVESDNSCGFGSTDVVNSSTIDLATTLAANGSSGPETLSISPNSSALEEVPSSACTAITTDERGLPRPGIAGQTSCDAGAFELQHTPVTLTQGSPTSASVAAGSAFSGQLAVTNATGTVTYTVTSAAAPPLGVSSTGAITAPTTTPPGTYSLSGTDSDPAGDTGTWSFTLTVRATTLYVDATQGTTTTCLAAGAAACPTIQDAIDYAQSTDISSDAVTIQVAAGTYHETDTITAGGLASLTISGAGQSDTIVSGGGAGSVFTIKSGTVTISGLTITGGAGANGSGVYNAAHATLTNDTFSGDTATTSGGGVYNAGTASMIDDTFSGDTAGSGGAVYNAGTATLPDDTFSGDTAGSGGAVYNEAGTASMIDDTFSADTAIGSGGGVYNNSGGTAIILNSILDSAGCSGTITDGGHNVESDNSCGFGSTDVVNSSTIDLAATLAANGSSGPETLSISLDSSALEEVPSSACTAITTDERGLPRPGITGQTSCDAGAFELQHTPATLTQSSPTTASVVAGSAFSGQLAVTNATGTVTYTVTSAAAPPLGVSSTGAITAPATTPPGTYSLSGTDSDPAGDTGTWSFTLTVRATTLYVDATEGTTTTCFAAGAAACPTIQDAIDYAQSTDISSDAVTIQVAAGTYHETDTITAGGLASLTISGAGQSGTFVSGGGLAGSVFTISSGTVTISGLTITGGAGPNGGGVLNAGHATLTNDTFSLDTATSSGGAVYNNAGTATLSDDTFSGDAAIISGGAVYNNAGTATLTDDTFSGDNAGLGGAVYNILGTASMIDDTYSADTAGSGGAVFTYGTASMIDDTLSADTATGHGGGLYNYNGGTATISNSILDSAGCSGTITDGGHNVESDNSCGFGSTDVVNSSTIDLATTLAANGSSGPETLSISPGSSALEEVPSSACTAITTDERGLPRPGIAGQTSCDAGAFELQAASVTPAATAPGAPTGVTATPGNTSAAISWIAPTSNGGSAITGYNVYEGTTSGGESTTPVNSSPLAAAATSYTATGLTNGSTYYFTVEAVNSAGSSLPSGEATATPRTVPGAPTGLSAAAGNAQVSLSWTAPTSTGGASIQGYNVYEGTTSGGESGTPVNSSLITGTSYSATGLANGTTYYFTVTAVNSAGSSNASVETAAIPEAGGSGSGSPPGPTPPTPPSGSISSASSASGSATGTASAANDGTTASATGVGALTVAQYGSNPAGPPTFSSSGEYFNVALSSGNSFTSLGLTDCNLGGGTSLRWWNPAASGGTGAWELVSDQSYSAGPPPCVAATINSSSSPDLAQLTGTVFAVANETGYTSVLPTRICDTRSGNPSNLSSAVAQCNGKTLHSGQPLAVNVAGLAGVPPSGAIAVVLNVTVTNPSSSGFLTVYPGGQSAPLSSNLNFTAGQTVANAVEVGLGPSGQIGILTNARSADVVIDVEGYVAEPELSGSGLYNGITPTRICDTRTGMGPSNQCTGKTMAPNSTITVHVAGLAGVPASAEAVALNVTVTDTSGQGGYLTVFPGGSPPTASNLNWSAGQTVANLVVGAINSSGDVSLYNHSGSANVVIDVLGYYSGAGGTGAQFTPAGTPTRICDTRAGSAPTNQCTGKTMTVGSTMTVQVTGLAGVPAGTKAVAIDVTVTDATASSYLTVFPSGTRPLASSINWAADATVPNLVIATLSSSGQITLYNYAGSADLVIDVLGWYS